ncbi:MAG: hypothetical protein RSH25_10215, partial [Bacteroides sp.]|uniref:hypothetical protein n=1 Tax=Bacteroides sp. TaxID=29523 RepID=UPI002FC70A46
ERVESTFQIVLTCSSERSAATQMPSMVESVSSFSPPDVLQEDKPNHSTATNRAVAFQLNCFHRFLLEVYDQESGHSHKSKK